MQEEEIALTPPEYRIAVLKNTPGVILSRYDALRLRGYGNWDFSRKIEVYTTKELPDPFSCVITDDLQKIDYSLLYGIPVCSTRQAFIDVLNDPRQQVQILLEALGDYYYLHDQSFDSLDLPPDQQVILNCYTQDAIDYWRY